MTRDTSERTTSRDPFDQGRGTWAGGWILVGAIIVGAAVGSVVVVLVLSMLGGQ